MFRAAFVSLTTLALMTDLAQAASLAATTDLNVEVEEWESLPTEFAQITDEASDDYGLA